MIALHRFLGRMDLDSPDSVIQKGVHRTARNGIFKGVPGNYRFESLPGTTAIPNPYLPVTGTNKSIGTHYDAVNQMLYDLNWNSTGFHAIYIFSTQQQTWQQLIQIGVNTIGDPLSFTAFGRITSIDILYGDGNSGDLLFYVDSLKRPRKLNIQRLLNNGYAGVKDNYLKVIKAPPAFPPQATYENDATVTGNACLNHLFQFAETWLYDDFEESVKATGSQVPLPSDPFDPTNNVSQTRNARIAIYVQTGDQNVKKLRIYGRITQNGSTSDWVIVDTLIKADLGIPDNTMYRYLFFNTVSYDTADPKFTVLDQDFVPQEANCQSLLDGTTISYSGIKEGYDFFNPSLNITSANQNVNSFGANGTLFFAAPNGIFTGNQPQLTIYLTGVGTNDGFGNPTTLEKPPTLMVVKAKSGVTDVGFSYLNIGSVNGIPLLLSSLQASAISAGWVFISSTTNSITIYYPTGNVVLQSSYTQGVSGNTSPYLSPIFAHMPEATYKYGIVYRDEDGRTNGVISNIQGQVKTPIFNPLVGQIPGITIGLAGYNPPLWARSYAIVRTDNLTYDKHLYWVSNQAFCNIGQSVSKQYAYVSITNFDDYNTNINAVDNVVSYSFTQGDRIRILGRFDVAGAFNLFTYDYAILGVVVNPVINGIAQAGTFIQIQYPTADINAGYKFDGSDDYQNYKFLIYSLKEFKPENENAYFEIGQTYGIGNPGTISAYHMGNIADNTVNITDGDIFFRQRTIPVGNTYPLTGGPEGAAFQYFNTRLTPSFPTGIRPGNFFPPIPASPQIVTSRFTIGTQLSGVSASLSNGAVYPVYSSADWLVFNTGPTPLTVRFRATVPLTVTVNTNFAAYAKILTPTSSTPQTILAKSQGLIVNTQYNIELDGTMVVPPNGKLFILYSNVLPAGNLLVSSYIARLDIIKNVTIPIFETSFSDIYRLVTNSDNRPNIVDTTAKQTYFSTLFRFSRPYQLGTNINNTNRFYPNNLDEFDKSFGDVMRTRIRGREMIVFQYRRCGHVGVYQKYISDNSSSNNLITTDSIITPNNIQYYEGEYGIGNQPDSLASSGYVDYFADPVKGFWCRLALNGIEPISELYKVQTFAGTNLPYYLNTYNNQFGGKSAILGVFNFNKDRDGEAIFVLQSGTSDGLTFAGPGGSTITQPAIFINNGRPTNIPGQAISFNERQNSWVNFLDIDPDSIICCENVMYAFKNGVLYSFANSSAQANFFGTQYPCTITIPFNDNLVEKKTFIALTQVSSTLWYCPSIYTDLQSYPGQRQESNLVNEDFALLENEWNASFWNDQHSPLGQFDGGENLKGSLIVIQFQVDNPSGGVNLSDLSVRFIESHRNNK